MDFQDDEKSYMYYTLIRRKLSQAPPRRCKIVKAPTNVSPNQTMQLKPTSFILEAKRPSNPFPLYTTEPSGPKPGTAKQKVRKKWEKLVLMQAPRPTSTKARKKSTRPLNLSLDPELSPDKYTFNLTTTKKTPSSKNATSPTYNAKNFSRSMRFGPRKSFPHTDIITTKGISGISKISDQPRELQLFAPPRRPSHDPTKPVRAIQSFDKPVPSTKSQPKQRIKRSRMVSFGKNSDTNVTCGESGRSEDISAKDCAFTYLADELKPLFFFNVNPRESLEELQCETPGFIDSGRASAGEKDGGKTRKVIGKGVGKSRNKLDPSSIWINKTTIINNIINNAAKKKLANVSKIYMRNPQARGARKIHESFLSHTYNHIL